MTMDILHHYWTRDYWAADAFIGANLVGALILGALVGYERSYKGRAAGMRVYGLVCMASAALTIFVGYAPLWYGGGALQVVPDPTRITQGIVSGIGFLCAGVIMKDGFTISGLTTAASIWTSSAIGVLLGVGFYGAAVLLALLCMVSMSLRDIEARLPGRATVDVSLTFRADSSPNFDKLAADAKSRGYRLMRESLTITFADKLAIWKFSAVAMDRSRSVSPAFLSQDLASRAEVIAFAISPVRH